jgi:hypothetical protein
MRCVRRSEAVEGAETWARVRHRPFGRSYGKRPKAR